MGKFDSEHRKLIQRGLELFNEAKYWECHEELEDLWMEEMSGVRYIYWALIQVATALYHAENLNYAGASGQIEKAKEKVLKIKKMEVESAELTQIGWENFISLLLETDLPIRSKAQLTGLFNFRFL